MKNLKYILVPALAGILFASCNTEAQGPSQAELDSQVEAKVKDATDKMKADCDAQIMNAAQLKKDSILIKISGGTPAAKQGPIVRKPVPPKAPATPKVTEPVKTEPVKVNPKPTNVNDRGNNANNAPKNVNDRGSKAADAPKTVNDR